MLRTRRSPSPASSAFYAYVRDWIWPSHRLSVQGIAKVCLETWAQTNDAVQNSQYWHHAQSTMTAQLRQRVVPAVGDAAHSARFAVPPCPPPSNHRLARPRDAQIADPHSTLSRSAGARRGGASPLQAMPGQTAAQRSPAPARPDPFATPAMLFVGFSSDEVAVLEECFADDTTLGKP